LPASACPHNAPAQGVDFVNQDAVAETGWGQATCEHDSPSGHTRYSSGTFQNAGYF
jgi:hypothetical protein